MVSAKTSTRTIQFGHQLHPRKKFAVNQPFITLPNPAVQVLIGNSKSNSEAHYAMLSYARPLDHKLTRISGPNPHFLQAANMSYQKPEKDFGEGPVRLLLDIISTRQFV